ncbi:short-chain dehydrogenase [Actinocatenispora thailandica]|uniref:Short-chain dehydrogenase n=1 Tax=Actinocatenispora thailandica TaxID=227318 RepID=A0A7R7DRQ0_9ACTN|nr:SDR family oxidoreductase [Actinocatenispora thailandica]BCJ36675.1 short-chain dehydrogenase [Actinocatenispora thailandica]
MPTIAIVGAGARLGLSLGRVFGRHGYQVALLARNPERLDGLVQQLTAENVDAAGFTADVLNRPGLTDALARAADRFGGIDVLEYSPTVAGAASGGAYTSAVDLTVDGVQAQVDTTCHGALAATRAVLPAMRAAGSGALLYTTGAASVHPTPMFAGPGIAAAGLRNWVLNLNALLADEGVYACHVSIGVWLEGTPTPTPDTPTTHPDVLAETYWQLAAARTEPERLITA